MILGQALKINCYVSRSCIAAVGELANCLRGTETKFINKN